MFNCKPFYIRDKSKELFYITQECKLFYLHYNVKTGELVVDVDNNFYEYMRDYGQEDTFIKITSEVENLLIHKFKDNPLKLTTDFVNITGMEIDHIVEKYLRSNEYVYNWFL